MMWHFLALLCVISPGLADPVTILTEYGEVVGQTMDIVFDSEMSQIMTFNGMPYAKPPLGSLRFMPTEKAEDWTEPFIADSLGSSCPQDLIGFTWLTHPGWLDYDEDCLNMNIAAPADISGGPYPVMVFFHGGGFTVGANIQYPGHFLASRGVVAISANYRLGNLGFAYSGGDGAAPGNAGLWDQVMVLEFIKDNIAQFGGDPNKVTVYGQSAGAASASHHMVSPQSAGRNLLHQAILESGTESNFWSMNWPAQESVHYLETVAQKNDCPIDDHFIMVECLQQVNAFVLANTSFECKPGHFCQGMAPVVDGLGGFLPELPEDLRKSGSIMNGPIITGINRDDGSLYTDSFIPEAREGGFNESEFEFYVWDRLMVFWAPLWENETAENVAEAVYWNYKPWPYVEDENANRQQINELVTDAAFGAPWDRQARLHHPVAPVYTYIYDYRGRNTTQIFAEWMGVPHMAEIPYVFGLPLLKMAGNEAIRNDSGIVWDVVDWTEEDQAHAIFFITLLTNFVKYGDPTPEPVEDPLGGMISWPQYTEENKAYLYVANITVHSGVQWKQQDYAFWLHYFDYLDKDAPIPILEHGQQSNWFDEAMSRFIQYLLDIY